MRDILCNGASVFVFGLPLAAWGLPKVFNGIAWALSLLPPG